MRPKSQRLAWITVVVLLLAVVGAVGFGPGVAAAHGGLADLVTMHERGQLTDEEFAAAKRKLLGS